MLAVQLANSLCLESETHCTIFGCPRRKIGIMKQSWRFLWSWLLIGGPMSYSDRFKDGRCHSIVTKDSLRKFSDSVRNTAWSSHSVFAATSHVNWPANKNAMWSQHDMALKHKIAYFKLLSLPLCCFHFFSADIKTPTAKVWFIVLFLFTTILL